MTLSIINYGCGNIGSIPNMLKRCGATATIANSPDDLRCVSKIILPGVGAFGHAMNNLEKSGFIEPLNQLVCEKKIPILGICLGMQILGESSDESPNIKGLGWIKGHLEHFKVKDFKLKVPHMGWNNVCLKNNTHPVLSGLDDMRFYHVHSYHYNNNLDKETVLGTCKYGYEFPTIIGRDNIIGVQFHPEKSHRHGLQLLKNFAEL